MIDTSSDLGENALVLFDYANRSHGTIVDIGLREGKSTEIFLQTKNRVIGIEVDESVLNLPLSVTGNEKFRLICGESATTGRGWSAVVDGVFIDTVHVKEQTIIELYYWYRWVKVGGWIGFHDTNWADGHNDRFGGVVWETVSEGIKTFFGLGELCNLENDSFKIEHFPDSYGMTFITKKKHFTTAANLADVLERRNYLINSQWNKYTIATL